MTYAQYRQFVIAFTTSNRTKYYLRAVLLVTLAIPRPATLAQSSETKTPPARTTQHRSRALTIDDRVKMLTKTLELNAQQQAAVKNILVQRQQQTLQIRQDPSISGGERIDRFRNLQVVTVERIRAVLNDEQKQKYDPLAAQKAKSTPERSVEDWLKLTTPKK